MDASAFVSEYPQISNRLMSPATLKNGGNETKVQALWDTGASRTCISTDVVISLGLVPLGKQQMQTPSGPSVANTFQIDILLPNNVIVQDLVVCDSAIGALGIGALIGMDIINLGDFAVSNFDGKTVFTFRTPSQAKTNYVSDLRRQRIIGPTHGKGKGSKKKK